MSKSEQLQQTRFGQLVNTYGLPRLIITGFLIFLFIMAPITGSDLATQITNVINRFSWNAVLVLAMVPMIHSGCGLNFGIPLGVLSGLLGGTLAIELGFTGPMSFVMAIVVSTPFAILFGGGYGALLNRIKGGEMMVATYVGFSSVSFMCIMWLMIPYKNPSIVMAYTGVGLRNMFALDSFYANVLSKLFEIDLNPWGINLVIPTGSLLFFALLAFLMWAFLHTKTGTAMTAVGSNPTFAKASGINVDRIRLLSVILSTWLGAIGIIVYQQGFGFVQLYTAPQNMTMPAVAAVLIGGASVNKASISNVIIGTLLFQGLVTMTPTVITALIHTDVSEVIRIIVSNGMVVYALTRKTEGLK
ncbi:MAG: ABC transporter permease [Oscillospiraceae bacterium]|jgi:simple sugar transport system permease protein|nr:ABC transporter permease [Oscillospiraceae bacterium]